MPLTNYQRGRNKEYRIVDYYRERGWIAFRSAGSHSPFDVIAIHKGLKQIRLIQSKLTNLNKLGKAEKDKILLEGNPYSGNYEVFFELWD